MSQVNLAYENVKEVDGLDITREGAEMWEAASKRYDERIDRVEVCWGGTGGFWRLAVCDGFGCLGVASFYL